MAEQGHVYLSSYPGYFRKFNEAPRNIQGNLTALVIVLFISMEDNDLGLFSIYGLARYQPMREDVTYVTSSLIGWYLVKPYRHGPNYKVGPCNGLVSIG